MSASRVFRLYTGALASLAAGVLVGSAPDAFSWLRGLDFLCFWSAYVAVEILRTPLPGGTGLSFSPALTLGAIAYLGSGPATVLPAVGAAAVALVRRTRPLRSVLSAARVLLGVAVAGFVYDLAGALPWPTALLLAGLALCVADVALSVPELALLRGPSLWPSAGELLGLPVLWALGSALLAVPLVSAARLHGPEPTLLVATLAGVGLSLCLEHHSRRWRASLADTLVPAVPGGLEVLGRAKVSGEAGPAPGVDGRLVGLVSALAREAGLDRRDAEAVRWAALIHGGNLDGLLPLDGVRAFRRDAGISGDGLDRDHPLRVSRRAASVGSLLRVARILETHHEHYNGWGYPYGLYGDEIPLPAALLGVAETYLSLVADDETGEAPMGRAQALRYIRTRAGEQFHPRAVEALERVASAGTRDLEDPDRLFQEVAEAGRSLREAVLAADLVEPFRDGESAVGLRPRRRGAPRRAPGAPKSAFTVPRAMRDACPAERYRDLLDLARVFSSSLSVPVVCSRLAESVRRLSGLACIVHFVEGDGETLSPVAVAGLPPQGIVEVRVPIGEGIAGLALAEIRTVTALDLQTDPRVLHRERARELGLRSGLATPLVAGEAPVGVLCVFDKKVRCFAPAEVDTLETLADLAGLALNNALLYRRIGDRVDELTRTQTHLAAVLNTVPVGILTFATDGTLTTGNRQGLRLLGEIGLDPFAADGEGADVAATAEPIAGAASLGLLGVLRDRLGTDVPVGALRRGRPCGPETVALQLAGGRSFFEVWAAPLEGLEDASPSGVLVVLDDVTRAKRLEEEIRRSGKLAAVGEVAAKAAHEIRNPLTAILGFVQLLGLYCPVRSEWPECRIYVDRMAEEIARLGEITGSMLALARPADPTFVRADLARPVVDALVLLASRASADGVALEGPTLPSGIEAEFDPGQMKQVVLNLVQNALDAVSGPGGPPPGHRRVSVRLGYARHGRRRAVSLRVSDNGPGVRPDHLPRLFTPFFTTKASGTGLGLAVSKGVVEAHGGTIRVRPARGCGAVFEVLLPAPPGTGSPPRTE
ncbi:MAG: GAF domain-containing protein [Firmicutes bacterium]|nr:GAF domain-containing protein [Bacillota bacterium]